MDDLAVAVEAVKGAAEVVRAAFHETTRTSWKSSTDPVTETDEAAEQAMLQVIRRHRPDDLTLTEEAGGAAFDGERVWIGDPLDGTVNFVHGIPHVAVSLGLWVDGAPRVGVVADVMGGELFTATLGGGAHLDRTPISVSNTASLGESIVATGFPYDRNERGMEYGETVGRILTAARGIRRFGAAALDLCWVAAGRYDAYTEASIRSWDGAAGILLVTEAGGKITRVDGTAHDGSDGSIVASNGSVHDDLVGILTP